MNGQEEGSRKVRCIDELRPEYVDAAEARRRRLARQQFWARIYAGRERRNRLYGWGAALLCAIAGIVLAVIALDLLGRSR